MNILHAQTDPAFLDRFRQMLGSAARADIAVGYLFISGFNAVADELAGLEKVRILVGRTGRSMLEEIARGMQQADALRARLDVDGQVRRSEKAAIGAQAVAAIKEGIARVPQTDGEAAGLRRLRDLIGAGKVEIKAYPRGTLHAKAYLCWYRGHAEPGSAIVGSSNFSLAGFTGNTELNVRVTGDAEMHELGRWFDALWADSVDVTDEIAIALQRSWAIAEPPPYHVYLKALYELYGDQLETPELEPTTTTTPELANFQLDAVRRALRMVDQHGGCFVGDVVGLGKTYIGAEIVRQLQFTEPRGRFPLIICPAGLKPMWEKTNELFGLGAAVISMSALKPPPAAAYDEELGQYVDPEPAEAGGIDLMTTYPNRGVVLVDEVHNFRNDATKRYAALAHYLQNGEHKAVLLSATPQNLGPADIYHQLRLFLDDLDHGLNLEPPHLREYFAAIQRWYTYEIEVENWAEDAKRILHESHTGTKKGPPIIPPQPAQPTVPYARIEQVLNPVFVRRRRNDIKELYGDDVMVNGKRIIFPEPVLENLRYRLDKVYAKAGAFSEIERGLRTHQGARYLAVNYLRPEAKKKEAYRDLLRARNRVARLMRYLLYKRLESSVAAFRGTLGVLMRSNRNFKEALEAGYVPIGQTATNYLSGEDFDADVLLDRLATEETLRIATDAKHKKLVHDAQDFETDRWLGDLDADYAILAHLQATVSRITPDDDDKLRALRTFLDRPDVRDGKVLIFSEAEATIHYLYEQLNPGGADPAIERLSGANRNQIQPIIKRFAPAANLRTGEVMPGPEVRVLLATDVISEGQNLQDCNRVLNYDLHWNPVRLIQRFGRVDRIGTTYEKIYLHNTWPDTDVDAQLTLTERLTRRIQAFHDFIGLDAQLLSESERINPTAMYRIYEEKRLPEQDDVLDEVAAYQRGISILQTIKQENAELWRMILDLPDGLRTALPARRAEAEATPLISFQRALSVMTVQLPLGASPLEVPATSRRDEPQPGESLILLKSGERASSYAVGDDRRPRQITDGQFVAALECTPETPAMPLPRETNQRVMAAYDAMRAEMNNKLGRMRRPGMDSRTRRYVNRSLRLAREEVSDDTDTLQRISALQQIFAGYLPSGVLAELAEIPRMQMTGTALVRRLDALRVRHRLTVPDPDEEDGSPAATEIVRIICSNGFT